MIYKQLKYDNNGIEIFIRCKLDYKHLKCFEYPKSCVNCPVGFATNNKCGRNIPFRSEDYYKRPETCKLKKITMKDILHELNKEYGEENEI